MDTPTRTVRVFLSSTFRDFAEERDLLVRKVFPELRRKCRERQVELVDVDLRWGITEEEAQQGKVLPICLAEIDRSRPFFMGFLGERYGWAPEKDQYDLSLLMEQPWLDEHRGGKSVTELEILHGVLNNPAMEDRAFFYFRDPAYSESKGGAYLSEGTAEKGKLDALKERIRRSGFPVVEAYPDPEALAERVREDLWKLIDEAYPESEVPDALAHERMGHEAFASSRLGLYIGGEKYVETLDAAISEESGRPVLVAGASGGGKSALLANWANQYASAHPEAIVLTHFLGTSFDAADPVRMAIRLLREIARITGEELVLEGDPRKALRMLGDWLEKAGDFARGKGGVFVLVLDALDKMTGQRDLDWWPGQLPEGVALVASCLDGGIRDILIPKMDWTELRVSPLERADCESFIRDHLAKYRKSLTPELTTLVVGHPLSGNPLFLRTLLEELRVFGVHEELDLRLGHYLASETIDDLFERVLDRIESDNTPQAVRAALEVLWAARESFAEDELLTVSGLPPVVWAPVHIALDESLIGAGGRIAFGHDYLRKAVEDRYLPTAADKERIRRKMADFCSQAMDRGREDVSTYVRRHAVAHFLEVEDWDNATAALCDLEFIAARARVQELGAMLLDYAAAGRLLPEGEAERKIDEKRQAELDRYAREMAGYAAAWARIRDGSGEQRPSLPAPVPQIRPWTAAEIEAERNRITGKPNRLDCAKAFRVFIATNITALQEHASSEELIASLARNDAPAGPVHEAGARQIESSHSTKLFKRFPAGEIYNPLPACQAVLEGHTDEVRCLVLSADGRHVVSGGDDCMLRVWDVATGECVKVLEGHASLVRSLVLTSDGRRIISGSCDNTLRVWDVDTGACLRVLEGHTGWVTCLSLSTDGRHVVSGGDDYMLRVWDVATGECVKVLEGHASLVRSLVLTSDGRRIISGSCDNTLRVWDVDTGACLRVLEGHTNSINFLSITPDGCVAVSAGADKTLRLWDVDTGECLKVLEGHTGWVTCLSLSADGRRIVSGSSDNTLRFWDVDTGACLRVLEGHTNSVECLVLSADGRRVVSGSHDKTLRVWNVETGKCLQVLAGHVAEVQSLVLSGDGRRVISGSLDKTLRVWNAENGECLHRVMGHTDSVESLALIADGRRVVSGSRDSTHCYWDIDTAECLHCRVGHLPVVSEDRGTLASVFLRFFHVWDLESGECHKVFEGHTGWVDCLALSADGRRVVSGSRDKDLRVWDVETGQCLKVLAGHTAEAQSLVLSADGRRVISASHDKTLRVWNVETGECLQVLGTCDAESDWGFFAEVFCDAESTDTNRGLSEPPSQSGKGHTGWVTCLSLSADERRVVSASHDKTLRVWNVETGECLQVFAGHTDSVECLVLSADGRRVVSGSRDDKLCVWDVESGACLHVLEGDTNSINLLSVTPDGCVAVSAGSDNTLRLWNLDTGEPLAVFFLRGLASFSIDWSHRQLVAGFADGRVEFYQLENLPLGPFITTARRELESEDLPAGPVTARPVCCGQVIAIPPGLAGRIEHWHLAGQDRGDDAYTDPALLLECPSCGTALRMNPFFVNIRPWPVD